MPAPTFPFSEAFSSAEHRMVRMGLEGGGNNPPPKIELSKDLLDAAKSKELFKENSDLKEASDERTGGIQDFLKQLQEMFDKIFKGDSKDNKDGKPSGGFRDFLAGLSKGNKFDLKKTDNRVVSRDTRGPKDRTTDSPNTARSIGPDAKKNLPKDDAPPKPPEPKEATDNAPPKTEETTDTKPTTPDTKDDAPKPPKEEPRKEPEKPKLTPEQQKKSEMVNKLRAQMEKDKSTAPQLLQKNSDALVRTEAELKTLNKELADTKKEITDREQRLQKDKENCNQELSHIEARHASSINFAKNDFAFQKQAMEEFTVKKQQTLKQNPSADASHFDPIIQRYKTGMEKAQQDLAKAQQDLAKDLANTSKDGYFFKTAKDSGDILQKLKVKEQDLTDKRDKVQVTKTQMEEFHTVLLEMSRDDTKQGFKKETVSKLVDNDAVKNDPTKQADLLPTMPKTPAADALRAKLNTPSVQTDIVNNGLSKTLLAMKERNADRIRYVGYGKEGRVRDLQRNNQQLNEKKGNLQVAQEKLTKVNKELKDVQERAKTESGWEYRVKTETSNQSSANRDVENLQKDIKNLAEQMQKDEKQENDNNAEVTQLEEENKLIGDEKGGLVADAAKPEKLDAAPDKSGGQALAKAMVELRALKAPSAGATDAEKTEFRAQTRAVLRGAIGGLLQDNAAAIKDNPKGLSMPSRLLGKDPSINAAATELSKGLPLDGASRAVLDGLVNDTSNTDPGKADLSGDQSKLIRYNEQLMAENPQDPRDEKTIEAVMKTLEAKTADVQQGIEKMVSMDQCGAVGARLKQLVGDVSAIVKNGALKPEVVKDKLTKLNEGFEKRQQAIKLTNDFYDRAKVDIARKMQAREGHVKARQSTIDGLSYGHHLVGIKGGHKDALEAEQAGVDELKPFEKHLTGWVTHEMASPEVRLATTLATMQKIGKEGYVRDDVSVDSASLQKQFTEMTPDQALQRVQKFIEVNTSIVDEVMAQQVDLSKAEKSMYSLGVLGYVPGANSINRYHETGNAWNIALAAVDIGTNFIPVGVVAGAGGKVLGKGGMTVATKVLGKEGAQVAKHLAKFGAEQVDDWLVGKGKDLLDEKVNKSYDDKKEAKKT